MFLRNLTILSATRQKLHDTVKRYNNFPTRFKYYSIKTIKSAAYIIRFVENAVPVQARTLHTL
jgi:hypothetical protein